MNQDENQRATGIEPSTAPVLHIRASRGWSSLDLGELWRGRELLYFLASREIKGRYRQMALGPLWIVLRPVLNMVVFSLIFGGLAKLPSEGVPYPVFTLAAILPWTFFATSAGTASNSLVTRLNLISKIYFPRLLIPLVAVFSGLVDLAVSFLVLLAMLIYYGIMPTWGWLALPVYVVLAAASSLAVGLWTATIAVRFRDVQYAITHGLQIWMFASPVAYSADLVPERWQTLYQLNPMYWVIEGFRWALLGTGSAPDWRLLPTVLVVAAGLVSGAYMFRRTERTIVDLI